VAELPNIQSTKVLSCVRRLTLAGKGDEAPGRRAGDLVLVVRQALHARFERRGADLLTCVEACLTV